jgi:GNAT superfamily N-acetyltransferase
MSKRVARNVTPQPLHSRRYREDMVVRPLGVEDLEAVVGRVGTNLARDAARNPLINAAFSAEVFSLALAHAREHTWVALDEQGVVGHLYGALLESPADGPGAWVGPDGVSFDDGATLAALYATAGNSWTLRGARDHYVWARDDDEATRPWHDLGFARAQVRGVLDLSRRASAALTDGYALRRGGLVDLEIALRLDRILDAAEGRARHSVVDDVVAREEWRELLEDDDVNYYVVEFRGDAVAQCLTYPLSPRRGSFDDSLHVSAVVVTPTHQHRGVARALVDVALDDAWRAGFRYAETNWRVTNERAGSFWRRFGFTPTYVRLHRTNGL